MKKLFRILATSLVIVFAFPLFACDGASFVAELQGKTPKEIYAASIEQWESATVYENHVIQNVEMLVEGNPQSLYQELITRRDGDNLYFSTTITMYVGDEESSTMTFEYIYFEGICYIKALGYKFAIPMEYDEFYEEYNSGTDELLLTLSDDFFKDISFNQTDDLYSLDFTITAEDYLSYFEDYLIEGTIISDVKYKVVFDDNGDLLNIVTTYSMDFYLDLLGGYIESDAICDSTYSFTLSKPIEKPADADTYQ